MAVISKTLRLVKSVATVVCVVLNFTSFHIYAATNVPNTFNSGTPALASEVNENFSSVASSIDSHWSRFPDRYYPDWRHDPDFYLELPTLGGFWGGRLNSEAHNYAFTTYNINIMNRYGPPNVYTPKRISLSLAIVPSADGSAGQISRQKAGHDPLAINLYTFRMLHNKDGEGQRIVYTEDESLIDDVYPSSGIWRYYMAREQVEEILPKIYSLLKLSSNEAAVSCGTITLHMNADFTIDVTGDQCVAVVPG